MQEWSSCFSISSKSNNVKGKENNAPAAVIATSTDKIKPMKPRPAAPSHSASSFSSQTSGRTTLEKETRDVNALRVVTEEKPLRERVSESKPPAAAPSLTNDDHRDILDCPSTHDVMNIDRKFTLANKYQPKALKDFICNRDQAIRMQGVMRDFDCNHFIFEGPAGVGKRTMIRAMLQEAFGQERVQAREECKSFNLKGEQIGSIQVRVKVSSQHVEVNLSDLKGYEKQVIVELIKETHNNHNKRIISNNPINPKSRLDDCRAIILYEADMLSTDALLYIKWVLERYKGFSKFFFCCNDVSRLQPIRSLCTVVQLLPPSKREVVQVLEFIAEQEAIELPYPLAEKIADKSKNNLRQAIRSFEASWHGSYPFTEDQEILTGWEDDIANIAKDMVEEQSPKQLYIIRGKLQNLIEHDVSPDFFFESLLGELKKHLDEPFQLQLDGLHKDYNRNDGNMLEISENELIFLRSRHEEAGKRLHDPARKNADHLFVRIEEFIAKFMSFYKISVTNNKSIQHDDDHEGASLISLSHTHSEI
uniref:AAA+ ATPase domain-containing protein n=2 Tax=Populus trichocarpa TaxID=3694 RepID=A0A3N7FZE9_POPTR